MAHRRVYHSSLDWRGIKKKKLCALVAAAIVGSLISQKAFIKWFRKSQFTHKFVNFFLHQ